MIRRITTLLIQLRRSVLIVFLAVGTTSAQTLDTGIVNLLISEQGMHRVTYEQLADFGVDLAGLNYDRLSLSSEGQQVAINAQGQSQLVGNPKFFGPGAYFEFYAAPFENLYSAQKAFTLHYGMPRKDIQRFDIIRDKFDKKAPAADDYLHTVIVEENRYYDYLAPSQNDPWHYGQLFAFSAGDTPGTAIDFELEKVADPQAELEVEVYGIVDIQSAGNDHHFVAKLNGVEVGDQQFDGNISSTLRIENVTVNNGLNTFQLFLRSIASTPFDAMGLNKITLRYSRTSTAQNDYLEGHFNGQQVVANGFSNKAVKAYRIGAENQVGEFQRLYHHNYYVGFNPNENAGTYVLVGQTGYKQINGVAPIRDSASIREQKSEYLIIAHNEFIGAELEEFVQLREADYRVNVVDVADVYGQFGNHVPSAQAIHDYIKFAAANLGTRFVTLVGSDTYDYKQFRTQSISFVPTRYVETPGGLLYVRQTPSDASYGDLDDDGVPDLPVGRLSVRTPGELAYVVEKIRDYQARSGYAGEVLLAADKEDVGNGVSFADDLQDMVEAMPEDWADEIAGDYLALPDEDGDQIAHDKIINTINNGVLVTAYIGHSSQQQWSRATPALLKASEIAGLNNIDKPTLVTQWGCWNTYFVDPNGNTMADKFLVGGLNGAVTVLGASTLTTSSGERALGIELNKRMFEPNITIGEAVIAAKQALAQSNADASDILLGWQILGDPALKINPQ